MPLHELIDEQLMQRYRAESAKWRRIAREIIRKHDLEHLKANRSNSPDKFELDFIVRRNYHRSTYDGSQDYTTIITKKNGEEIEKVVFDSLTARRYSILLNVRGTFFRDEFGLGYGKSSMDGPIKVYVGSGFKEIAPNHHNLGKNINDIAEMYRDTIGTELEKCIFHIADFCNGYIADLKRKK